MELATVGRYNLAAGLHLNPGAVTAASVSQNYLRRLSGLVLAYVSSLFSPTAWHLVSCVVTEPMTGYSNTSESVPFPIFL